MESLPDVDNHFHHKHTHSKPVMYQCNIPQHLSYPSRSDSQHLHYGSRPANIPSGTSRFNKFTSQPEAISVYLPKPWLSRSDYVPVGNRAMWPFLCPHSQFGELVYPAIKRVHSLHVPLSSIRSISISRTEVPPDDGKDCIFYDLADSYSSIRLRQFHSFTSQNTSPMSVDFGVKSSHIPTHPTTHRVAHMPMR